MIRWRRENCRVVWRRGLQDGNPLRAQKRYNSKHPLRLHNTAGEQTAVRTVLQEPVVITYGFRTASLQKARHTTLGEPSFRRSTCTVVRMPNTEYDESAPQMQRTITKHSPTGD